jgi:hypothetical protein
MINNAPVCDKSSVSGKSTSIISGWLMPKPRRGRRWYGFGLGLGLGIGFGFGLGLGVGVRLGEVIGLELGKKLGL